MDFLPATIVALSHAAKITGPTGGFGWQMYLDKGAPKVLNISAIQVRELACVCSGVLRRRGRSLCRLLGFATTTMHLQV